MMSIGVEPAAAPASPWPIRRSWSKWGWGALPHHHLSTTMPRRTPPTTWSRGIEGWRHAGGGLDLLPSTWVPLSLSNDNGGVHDMAADTKCRCKLHSLLHVSDETEEKQQRQVFVMPATYCRFATTLVFIL
jgi:hypothetical protein